jgi:hypothetical protein
MNVHHQGATTFSITALIIMGLIVTHSTQHNLQYYTKCHNLIVMLNVVMLNVVMLNVIILNVVMLNVVMLNVIILNVVMLNVVQLNANTLSVAALSSKTILITSCLNAISIYFYFLL